MPKRHVMKFYSVKYNLFGSEKEMNVMATDSEMAEDLILSQLKTKLSIDKEFVEIISSGKMKALEK